MHNISRSKRKGVGTVIGGILFVVLVVTSLLALYSFFGTFNSYVGNVSQSIKLNVAKSNERVVISSSSISSGVLTFIVTNSGSNTITLTDLWIYDTNTKALCCGDTTGVPPTTFAASAAVLSPGQQVTFTTSSSSQFTTTISSLSSTDTYSVSVVTQVGNSFSFQVGPNSAGMTFTSSSTSCNDVSSSTVMMGLGMSYTTVKTGKVYVTLDFQIVSPTGGSTGGLTSSYQLAYGSGTAPACNAAAAGTTIGNSFKVMNPSNTGINLEGTVTVVITTLSAGTAYWFDVQVLDSSTAQWTYSAPQLSVMEV